MISRATDSPLGKHRLTYEDGRGKSINHTPPRTAYRPRDRARRSARTSSWLDQKNCWIRTSWRCLCLPGKRDPVTANNLKEIKSQIWKTLKISRPPSLNFSHNTFPTSSKKLYQQSVPALLVIGNLNHTDELNVALGAYLICSHCFHRSILAADNGVRSEKLEFLQPGKIQYELIPDYLLIRYEGHKTYPIIFSSSVPRVMSR